MSTNRSTNNLGPNKLILPAIILACIPAVAVPLTIIFPSTQGYLTFFLPLGIIAAVLARVAIYQTRGGRGSNQERKLAFITYFLGLSPMLYFCGLFTYQLLYP